MSSRMDKYNQYHQIEEEQSSESAYNQPFSRSRSKKNEDLYQEINHEEYGDINLTSNAHVIGDNDKNVDIEKLKALLEKNYREEPHKSRVFMKQQELLEKDKEEDVKEEKEETKEYNINAIIAKAKKEKNVDYERERLKKVRDTQYDILKGLKLDKEEDEEEDELPSKVTSNKKDLMNLINTITEKELTREVDPLDILTDLKGSENTVVLDGIKEEINKKELEESGKVKPKAKEVEPVKTKEEIKKEIDKTFFTNSVSFSKSDFDDFNDLKENVETNKVLIKVVFIILVIALIVGILFFANAFFHLNWF